jgi:hypothetical protein
MVEDAISTEITLVISTRSFINVRIYWVGVAHEGASGIDTGMIGIARCWINTFVKISTPLIKVNYFENNFFVRE